MVRNTILNNSKLKFFVVANSLIKKAYFLNHDQYVKALKIVKSKEVNTFCRHLMYRHGSV